MAKSWCKQTRVTYKEEEENQEQETRKKLL